MNIDKLFSEVVGDFGYQQILYCTLFCLMNSYGAFQMLQSKFVVRDTSDFLCHISVEEGKPAVALLNTCTASEKHPNTRYIIIRLNQNGILRFVNMANLAPS